jgi:hypothetical protein
MSSNRISCTCPSAFTTSTPLPQIIVCVAAGSRVLMSGTSPPYTQTAVFLWLIRFAYDEPCRTDSVRRLSWSEGHRQGGDTRNAHDILRLRGMLVAQVSTREAFHTGSSGRRAVTHSVALQNWLAAGRPGYTQSPRRPHCLLSLLYALLCRNMAPNVHRPTAPSNASFNDITPPAVNELLEQDH